MWSAFEYLRQSAAWAVGAGSSQEESQQSQSSSAQNRGQRLTLSLINNLRHQLGRSTGADLNDDSHLQPLRDAESVEDVVQELITLLDIESSNVLDAMRRMASGGEVAGALYPVCLYGPANDSETFQGVKSALVDLLTLEVAEEAGSDLLTTIDSSLAFKGMLSQHLQALPEPGDTVREWLALRGRQAALASIGTDAAGSCVMPDTPEKRQRGWRDVMSLIRSQESLVTYLPTLLKLCGQADCNPTLGDIAVIGGYRQYFGRSDAADYWRLCEQLLLAAIRPPMAGDRVAMAQQVSQYMPTLLCETLDRLYPGGIVSGDVRILLEGAAEGLATEVVGRVQLSSAEDVRIVMDALQPARWGGIVGRLCRSQEPELGSTHCQWTTPQPTPREEAMRFLLLTPRGESERGALIKQLFEAGVSTQVVQDLVGEVEGVRCAVDGELDQQTSIAQRGQTVRREDMGLALRHTPDSESARVEFLLRRSSVAEKEAWLKRVVSAVRQSSTTGLPQQELQSITLPAAEGGQDVTVDICVLDLALHYALTESLGGGREGLLSDVSQLIAAGADPSVALRLCQNKQFYGTEEGRPTFRGHMPVLVGFLASARCDRGGATLLFRDLGRYVEPTQVLDNEGNCLAHFAAQYDFPENEARNGEFWRDQAQAFSVKNSAGETPLGIATRSDKDATLGLMQAAGGDLSTVEYLPPSGNGETGGLDSSGGEGGLTKAELRRARYKSQLAFSHALGYTCLFCLACALAEHFVTRECFDTEIGFKLGDVDICAFAFICFACGLFLAMLWEHPGTQARVEAAIRRGELEEDHMVSASCLKAMVPASFRPF